MSPKLQPVRGTHDILPDEARKRRYIEQILSRVAECYGYGQIETPMFEFSEVFHRTLGDTSDVVTKETYTFEDRGGESLTLRPEFTAGVVRAFISNGLQEKLPLKVYYNGAAFRYERPQKGRLRQFHQFGAELLGEPEPIGDVEMIAMAYQALTQLSLERSVTLELNSLGDTESRKAYRDVLVAYFQDHWGNLCEDSKQRLGRNPLRILDSKDEGDKKIVANAPRSYDYFTSQAAEFFAEVKEKLERLKIRFRINPRLVRGLDYYSHTVFEFTTDKLGAQGTVLAGGRYDGLVKLMGGPDVPGIGFAAGIERLYELWAATVSAMPIQMIPKIIAVIPIDDAQEQKSLELVQYLRLACTLELRDQNFVIELVGRGNMSKKMKRADRLGAKIALMLGEDEIKTHSVALKNLATGEQKTVPQAELITLLKH